MGLRSIVLILLISSAHFSYSQKPLRKFFKKSDRFFRSYVSDGKVDYHRIISDPSSLEKLTAFIATADLKKATSLGQKAFYLNAYHLLLINNVIKNYPVLFPLETIGFFSSVRHSVAGDTMTLNEIESYKLTKAYKDLRILFVLSSASLGSVNLPDFAFKPGKLEKQFKKRIKETVNDFQFVRVMPRSSKILLAESFKSVPVHFDFGQMIDLINQHRENPLPQGYSIDFYPANRKLNSSSSDSLIK